MFNTKDIQGVKDYYEARENYLKLFIIVALVVGYTIGLLY